MKLKDIFMTASSNMLRSKLRTALTILAIFIGAFTLTLTNGLGAGISGYVDRQVANVGQKDAIIITAQSTSEMMSSASSNEPQKYEPEKQSVTTQAGPGISSAALTDKDIETLRQKDYLTDVQPYLTVSPDFVQGANDDKFTLTVSTMGSAANLDLAAGQQLSSSSSENQIVLPLSFVSPLGFESAEKAINQSVTIGITDATGQQHTVTAVVVGVQQKGLISSSGAALNSTLNNTLYDLQSTGLPAAYKGKYQAATARMTGELTDARISEIKSNLEKAGFSGQTIDDQLGILKTVINAITYVLNSFAIIALLAASFGIVNTLLMSVQERTKEIGLMKAMGMRSSRVFMLFSFEAVLIGFWGSVIGVVSAIGVGTLVNNIASNGFLKDLPGFELIAFPPVTIALIIGLIMLIAFIAGTLPARRAAKQNPIDALRYE